MAGLELLLLLLSELGLEELLDMVDDELLLNGLLDELLVSELLEAELVIEFEVTSDWSNAVKRFFFHTAEPMKAS